MSTIIPAGYAQVSHFMTYVAAPSAPFVVTYGIDQNAIGGQPAVELCAAYFGSVVEGCCSTALNLTETWLKEGPTATGATFISTNGTDGGLTGDALPPNCALLVQKRTAAGGRKNRGRFYLPGIRVQDTQNTGEVEATPLGDFQDTVDIFLAGLLTETIPMVVLHDDVALAPTPVTQLVVQQYLATQRRRLR